MNYKYMFFHRNILVFKKPFLVIISKILFFLLCITLCHISIDAVLSIYMALKKSISRTLRYLALVLIESAPTPLRALSPGRGVPFTNQNTSPRRAKNVSLHLSRLSITSPWQRAFRRRLDRRHGNTLTRRVNSLRALTREPRARPDNVLTPLKRDHVPTIIKVSRSPRTDRWRFNAGRRSEAGSRRWTRGVRPVVIGYFPKGESKRKRGKP